MQRGKIVSEILFVRCYDQPKLLLLSRQFGSLVRCYRFDHRIGRLERTGRTGGKSDNGEQGQNYRKSQFTYPPPHYDSPWRRFISVPTTLFLVSAKLLLSLVRC